MAELAPNLIIKIIPKPAVKQQIVSQALDGRWVADVRGALTVQVLAKHLLWDLIDNLALQQKIADQHIWHLTKSGSYTIKSSYNEYFLSSTKFVQWFWEKEVQI